MEPLRIHLLSLPAVLLLTLSGCVLLAGGAAGAGTYAYISGNLKTTYDADMTDAWEASRAVVAELGMVADVEQHDAFSGSLKGTTADGKDFTISLSRVTQETTEVAIRIGRVGNRKRSEEIHSRISVKLRA